MKKNTFSGKIRRKFLPAPSMLMLGMWGSQLKTTSLFALDDIYRKSNDSTIKLLMVNISCIVITDPQKEE